jgi:hypothetical protein
MSGILRTAEKSIFVVRGETTLFCLVRRSRESNRERKSRPAAFDCSPVSVINGHRHPCTRRSWTPPSTLQSDNLWNSLLGLVGLLLGLLLGLLCLVFGLLASLFGLVLSLFAGLLGLALDVLATLASFGVLVFAVLACLVVAVLGVLLGFVGFLASIVNVLLRCVASGLVAWAGVVSDKGQEVGDDAESEGDQGGDEHEERDLVRAGFLGLGELVCDYR